MDACSNKGDNSNAFYNIHWNHNNKVLNTHRKHNSRMTITSAEWK